MTTLHRPGWAYERAGAASMIYNLRRHRREQMIRLATAYGVAA
jgi:predicted kinase